MTMFEQCGELRYLSNRPFKECQGCLFAVYCGRDCQMLDWKYGDHRAQCKELKAKKAHCEYTAACGSLLSNHCLQCRPGNRLQ